MRQVPRAVAMREILTAPPGDLGGRDWKSRSISGLLGALRQLTKALEGAMQLARQTRIDPQTQRLDQTG